MTHFRNSDPGFAWIGSEIDVDANGESDLPKLAENFGDFLENLVLGLGFLTIGLWTEVRSEK